MVTYKLSDSVTCIASLDWDRTLFDEIIPLPDGTSYNSYIVKGREKTALIDTADPRLTEEFLSDLKNSGAKIDYLISNHSEQDHSGLIPKVLELFPAATVVVTAKGKEFLQELLLIEESKFLVVGEGDTLDLGDKTLEFIMAPWVHWPETMLTYLREEKTLFPCDLFGAHIATDKIFTNGDEKNYEASKRYYAEIMMPFRKVINGHLEKLKSFEIEIIAPSHGQIHKNPAFIIDAYADWTSDAVKNIVVIPYVSMHDSTKVMIEYLTSALIKRGLKVKPFNLTTTDVGELAISLVDAATIVIGTPTMLVGPHPQAAYAANLANALRPKTKFASIIGSYLWRGKMVERLGEGIKNLNVEIIEPVVARGYPKDTDFKLLDDLADKLRERHKSAGLI